jgi:hypothetical protein
MSSVRFEKEITKTTTGAASAAAGLAGDKSDLVRDVGEALTKGGGPNGYLGVSRAQLGPRTNALTDATSLL